MAYASVEHVQSRVPRQIWEATQVSQPTLGTVSGWLDAWSRFVDGALAWKYVTPVVAPDADLLQEIVADLVAAQVWRVIGSYSPETPSGASGMQKAALLALGYDEKTRQANITLPNTPLVGQDEETGTVLPGFSFGVASGCRGR